MSKTLEDLLREHTAHDADNFRRLDSSIAEVKLLLVEALAQKANREDLTALRTRVYVLVALLFGSGVIGTGALKMLM